MIYLRADGHKATITKDLPITTGSVGLQVEVSLSEDFDGLASVVTFRAGTVVADVAYVGELVEVPPQVMTKPNTALLIGVYAQSADGRTVIPTVWDNAGIIQPGTLPDDFPQPDPAPSWAAQVQLWAEDAHNTADRLAEEVDGWEAGENERIAAESARDAAEASRARAEATRYSNESTRVTSEASRVLAEQDRQRAEGERESAESSRVSAETARAGAETARASAETARSSAESQRASAEAARRTAESGRASAESSRRTAESGRVSAEQSRVFAEQARSIAEQARDEAESAREDAESDRETEWATLRANAISATSAASDAASSASEIDASVRSAEQARVAAESSRAAAEAARETAESARQGAESSRASAESARALAETQRAAAESQRASAEQGRAAAESDRASAESQRVDAEDLRVAAEDEREQAWSELSQEAQEAIDAATEAAESVSDDVDALYNGNLQLFGNQLTGEMSGTIATPSDAYTAPPMALTVYGNSTQDGTPTPDAPVPILSVVDPVLRIRDTNFFDISKLFSGAKVTVDGTTITANAGANLNIYDGETGSHNKVSLSAIPRLPRVPAGNFAVRYSSRTGGTIKVRSINPTTGAANGHVTVDVSSSGARFTTTQPEILSIAFATNGTSVTNLCININPERYDPYQQFVGYDLQLPVTLRSLPDGTKDTLSLSYLRPSTRKGWAWYSREVVQRIGAYDGTTLAANTHWTVDSSGFFNVPNWYVSPNLKNLTNAKMQNVRSNMFKAATSTEWLSEYGQVTQVSGIRIYADPETVGSTVDSFRTWLAAQNFIFIGELATPITTTLDPIELPQLPAPTATVWCDGGSATPTFVMEYVRDTNIVIAELESIISDLATS